MHESSTTYKQVLQKAGLNQNEADLYLYLLEHGKTNIQQLLKETGLKRGNLYHLLYSLRDQGLVLQSAENKKLHFQLSDPAAIRPLLELQRQKVQDNIREVEGILPNLTSTYTLTYHKPGIVMFEGIEALRRVLEDSLTATDEILQITDSEAFDQYLPEEDAEYVRRRLQKQLPKRMLIPNSPKNREYARSRNAAYKRYTEIRFLPGPSPRFKTSQLIYDNKISYQTLQPESMIGVILEDPLISLLHRTTFNALWQQAPTLEQLKGK